MSKFLSKFLQVISLRFHWETDLDPDPHLVNLITLYYSPQVNGETLKGRSKAIFKDIVLDTEECWHMMNEIIGLFQAVF